MDIAIKKVELIEWIARVNDETLIARVEALRKLATKEAYEKSMPKTPAELQEALDRAEADILAGRVHTQAEVEAFFKAKFRK